MRNNKKIYVQKAGENKNKTKIKQLGKQ